MDNCKHTFRFLESSQVVIEGKDLYIDKYLCRKCPKLYIVNKETNKKIFLNNIIGEEVENDR